MTESQEITLQIIERLVKLTDKLSELITRLDTEINYLFKTAKSLHDLYYNIDEERLGKVLDFISKTEEGEDPK